MRLLFCSSTTLLFLAACGNVVLDAAAGGTGGSAGTGGVTTTGSGGQGGAAPTCIADGGPKTFPPAFKASASVTDCAIEHIPDCCITYAVGVASAQVASFRDYERACEHLPLCGCVGPTLAEDGKGGDIQVACEAGSCMTFVP